MLVSGVLRRRQPGDALRSVLPVLRQKLVARGLRSVRGAAAACRQQSSFHFLPKETLFPRADRGNLLLH